MSRGSSDTAARLRMANAAASYGLPASETALSTEDIRKYAPPEQKVYEGTPFAVAILASNPDRGMILTDIGATKLSPTSVRVTDTPYTRLVVPILMKINSGFDENKLFKEIQDSFKENYPDVKLESPPGYMVNTSSVHQFDEKLIPLKHTMYGMYQKERLETAKKNKALKDREGQLAGLFGGKKRRSKTSKNKIRRHRRRHTTRRTK